MAKEFHDQVVLEVISKFDRFANLSETARQRVIFSSYLDNV